MAQSSISVTADGHEREKKSQNQKRIKISKKYEIIYEKNMIATAHRQNYDKTINVFS